MPETGGNLTILIVEDDLATSQFLVDLLDLDGYTTLVADSGRAALAQLAAHSVSAVLLDRRLPDMDGLDVCRQIRATSSTSVPIILLTADRSVGLEVAARDAGISSYFSKPFEIPQLLDRLGTLIRD